MNEKHLIWAKKQYEKIKSVDLIINANTKKDTLSLHFETKKEENA